MDLVPLVSLKRRGHEGVDSSLLLLLPLLRREGVDGIIRSLGVVGWQGSRQRKEKKNTRRASAGGGWGGGEVGDYKICTKYEIRRRVESSVLLTRVGFHQIQ